MNEPLYYLFSGVTLGLAAGFSPGPLLALVINETVNKNRAAGFRVAVAPLLTDAPIVAISIYVLSQIANSNLILSVISFIGAAFTVYLGLGCLKVNEPLNSNLLYRKPLLKALITNFLSPHPYLFWTVVGAPLCVKAFNNYGAIAPALFIIGFYTCLVGAKILIAYLTDKSKHFINVNTYKLINRILAIALFVFALLFVYEGLTLVGVKL